MINWLYRLYWEHLLSRSTFDAIWIEAVRDNKISMVEYLLTKKGRFEICEMLWKLLKQDYRKGELHVEIYRVMFDTLSQQQTFEILFSDLYVRLCSRHKVLSILAKDIIVKYPGILFTPTNQSAYAYFEIDKLLDEVLINRLFEEIDLDRVTPGIRGIIYDLSYLPEIKRSKLRQHFKVFKPAFSYMNADQILACFSSWDGQLYSYLLESDCDNIVDRLGREATKDQRLRILHYLINHFKFSCSEMIIHKLFFLRGCSQSEIASLILPMACVLYPTFRKNFAIEGNKEKFNKLPTSSLITIAELIALDICPRRYNEQKGSDGIILNRYSVAPQGCNSLINLYPAEMNYVETLSKQLVEFESSDNSILDDSYQALRSLLVADRKAIILGKSNYLGFFPRDIFLEICCKLVPQAPTAQVDSIIKYRRGLELFFVKTQGAFDEVQALS